MNVGVMECVTSLNMQHPRLREALDIDNHVFIIGKDIDEFKDLTRGDEQVPRAVRG